MRPRGAVGYYNDPSSPYHGRPVVTEGKGYKVIGFPGSGRYFGDLLYASSDAPPPITTSNPAYSNDYGSGYTAPEGVKTTNDQTLNAVDQYLANQAAQGNVVNPNIEINDATLAGFLAQAQQEIDPYFSSQLKIAKESLLANLGFSRDEILRKEQEDIKKYGKDVRAIGESAAEQGFAQSGRREESERDLAFNTQSSIDERRRSLEFGAGNAARGFAQQYGTSELPSLNIGAAPQFAAGEYGAVSQGANRSLYTLSPETYSGLIGEQEFARRGAVRSRASELEQSYRLGNSIPARQITI